LQLSQPSQPVNYSYVDLSGFIWKGEGARTVVTLGTCALAPGMLGRGVASVWTSKTEGVLLTLLLLGNVKQLLITYLFVRFFLKTISKKTGWLIFTNLNYIDIWQILYTLRKISTYI
jgi:hypothetical protein